MLPRSTTFLVVSALSVCTLPSAAAPNGKWSLEEVIAAAQKGPRAQAAAELTNVARGASVEASGTRGPVLSMRGIVAPSPDINCVDVACTETDPSDPSVTLSGVFGRVELSIAQPLFTFGKISAARAASAYAITAAKSLERSTANTVAMEAARAFYGLKLARETLWMLEDGQERLTKALARINRELSAGSSDVTLQDRYRLETLGAEVEIRLADATEAESVALAGLRILAGDVSVDIDDEPIAAIVFSLGPKPTVVAHAVETKPEVAAASAAKGVGEELARLESANYWPDLLLVGSLTLAKASSVDEAPSAFANDPYNTVSGAAALALRWQIDPLAQRGRVAQAKARSRRAAHIAAAAKKQASFQAHETYASVERAGKRLAIAKRGERSAKAWLASVLQAEAVGTINSKDLADAYLALFTARGRTLEATRDWNLAVFEMRQITE